MYFYFRGSADTPRPITEVRRAVRDGRLSLEEFGEISAKNPATRWFLGG